MSECPTKLQHCDASYRGYLRRFSAQRKSPNDMRYHLLSRIILLSRSDREEYAAIEREKHDFLNLWDSMVIKAFDNRGEHSHESVWSMTVVNINSEINSHFPRSMISELRHDLIDKIFSLDSIQIFKSVSLAAKICSQHLLPALPRRRPRRHVL